MRSKEKLERIYGGLINEIKGKPSLDFIQFLKIRNFKAQISVETDEEKIRQNTKKAFEYAKDNENTHSIKHALNLLIDFEGIDVPSASAILHFAFPDKYVIMDKYCWERARKYSKEKLPKYYGYKGTAVNNYIKYLEIIKQRRTETGKTFREIESEWFYKERKKK